MENIFRLKKGLRMEQLDDPGSTKDHVRSKAVWRDKFWVVGPGCLLLAFFWQPALRLVQPFVLTSVSSVFLLALLLFDGAGSITRRIIARSCLALAIAMAMLGIIETIYFASQASAISNINDARCRVLEVRMLGAGPSRAADAAVFQALGCRPQTTAQVAPLVSAK